MELKNAVAVCLISLFSATLVVLIARSLDSQAASRLEPQLAEIVEELRALREGGGIAAPSGEAAATVERRSGRLLLPQQRAMSHLPVDRVAGPRDGSDALRLAVGQRGSGLEDRQLRDRPPASRWPRSSSFRCRSSCWPK